MLFAGEPLCVVVLHIVIQIYILYTHNIYSFMESCPRGCGFVLKAPYVTNKMHFHSYPCDVESAMKNIISARKEMFAGKKCFALPYLLLQVINYCHNCI